MDLLYSSDLHGQDVRTYHSKCDEINITLVLFEFDYKKRFGRLTKLKWTFIRGFVYGEGSDFFILD